MDRLAFVFSGQGAQYPGMGKELAEKSPAAAAIFQQADAIRPGTSQMCFSGTEAELAETVNTQPCIFAVELAAAAALEAAGITPQAIAGFSLGEVAALTYGGMVPFATGFDLVCRRGALMQADAEAVDSAMAAVLKLDPETVEQLCSQFDQVYPVNYNCPGQISVSGSKAEMGAFTQAVKAAGGRALPLRVRGGFHSPFMAKAAVAFGELLKDVELAEPKYTLYSDRTGRPYAGDYRQLLAEQISHPVRWQDIVTHMIESGIQTFVEVGPGKPLCGLISKTNSAVRCLHVEDWASLQETIEEVRLC